MKLTSYQGVRGVLPVLILVALLSPVDSIHAATLTFVSDTISTSAPSTASNHTIKFTITNSISANGTVTITPEASKFNIPTGLDVGDIDLSLDDVDTALATSAGGSTVGVSIIHGSSGSITMTFPQVVSANTTLIVKVGTNAIFGSQGTEMITNSANTGSYSIAIQSNNASSVAIDYAKAMVAIIEPINVGSSIYTTGSSGSGGGSSGGGSSGGSSSGGGGTGSIPTMNPTLPASSSSKADMNSDGRVNLIDFSIAAFWYKKQNPPANIDISGDGVVNLVDFSIMAFYWNT